MGYVSEHTGINLPSFTQLRDTAESAASLVGNYALPGSSLLTDHLVSKGSQNQLNSPLGKLAQLGTGLAGAGVGTGFTGIPASAGGNWETSLFSGGSGGSTAAAGSAVNPETLGSAGVPSTAGEGANVANAGAGGTTLGMSNKQLLTAGLAGVEMFGGKATPPLNPTLTGLAQPAQQASDKLMAQFNSGQLNPTDAASVAQWHQQQLESSKQYYANAGLADSSMAQQASAQIGQQAQQMQQQMMQNYLNQGLQAAGVAAGPMTNAVNLQIQQDQQAQQAQQDFMKTLTMISMGA